jgi:hypothetical protein
LARTPLFIARLASERVKLAMAALVDAYAMRLGLGSKDRIEPMLIIDPPCFICGSSALHSPKHGENVYAKRFLELVIRNILEFIISSLECGIVNKNIDGTERIDRLPGYRPDTPGLPMSPGSNTATVRLSI